VCYEDYESTFMNAIQERINEGRKVEFEIFYVNCDTDWDNQIDGREYRKEDITLTIIYH